MKRRKSDMNMSQQKQQETSIVNPTPSSAEKKSTTDTNKV